MLPCKLLLPKSISSIDSVFPEQVTPNQEHHDFVKVSQLLFKFQSSPDVESYKSCNALNCGEKEGAKEMHIMKAMMKVLWMKDLWMASQMMKDLWMA